VGTEELLTQEQHRERIDTEEQWAQRKCRHRETLYTGTVAQKNSEHKNSGHRGTVGIELFTKPRKQFNFSLV